MSFSSNYCLLPYVSYTRSAYNKDELKVRWVFLLFPYLQSFHITHLILPAIKLSFYSCSVVFSHNVGVSFVYFLQDIRDIMNVFQCLQKIWKKASGRWRGSCSSWSETLRLLPPQMTQTTCSSRKWLYPLHMHACIWLQV